MWLTFSITRNIVNEVTRADRLNADLTVVVCSVNGGGKLPLNTAYLGASGDEQDIFLQSVEGLYRD